MGILDTINDARKPGGLESLGRRVANIGLNKIPEVSTLEVSQNLQDLYGYFLANLLQTSNSSALKPLWLCFLDDVPDTVALAEKYDINGANGHHDLSLGHQGATSSIDFRGGKAALLAQEINMPGDLYNTLRVEDSNNMGGFLGGVIGTRRGALETAKIAYLETNYSFTDFVLRPWMLTATYESLKNVTKTNITMINYAKAGRDVQFVPRKIITLHNCVPVNIDTESYTYDGNDLLIRQVEWHYDSYTIKSGQFIGERDLLSSLDRVFNLDADNIINNSFGTVIDAAKSAAIGIGANFITNLAGEFGASIEDSLGIGSDPFSPTPQSSNDTVVSRQIASIDRSNSTPNNISSSARVGDDVIINRNDTPTFTTGTVDDIPPSGETLNDVVDQQTAIAARLLSQNNVEIAVNDNKSVIPDIKQDDVNINLNDVTRTGVRAAADDRVIASDDIRSNIQLQQDTVTIGDDSLDISLLQDDVSIREQDAKSRTSQLQDDIVVSDSDSLRRTVVPDDITIGGDDFLRRGVKQDDIAIDNNDFLTRVIKEDDVVISNSDIKPVNGTPRNV